jgi:hypothetical protein
MSTSIPTTTVENLPVIAYLGTRVLTTELLASLYGTETVNIRQNYANNADRFAEGKHFFKLEGEELKEFKRLGVVDSIDYPSLKFTSQLTLWTERGAARHAKILDTDAAWDVFERLEDAYFKPREEAPSNINDPALAALVKSLVELDQVKQRQAALDRKTDVLETRVQHVELQHRNGVPTGHLSKKQAHHLHGKGLSEDIFHRALAKLSVPTLNYVATSEDGHETMTFAYQEGAIAPAVTAFLANAVQSTSTLCESPLLDHKRFRYIKACNNH